MCGTSFKFREMSRIGAVRKSPRDRVGRKKPVNIWSTQGQHRSTQVAIAREPHCHCLATHATFRLIVLETLPRHMNILGG